jgi:hypothetical protein
MLAENERLRQVKENTTLKEKNDDVYALNAYTELLEK